MHKMCFKTDYICHLQGMLDRDIRTTKTPVYRSNEVREMSEFSQIMTTTMAFGSTNSTEVISSHSFCYPARTTSNLGLRWRRKYSLYRYYKSNYFYYYFIIYAFCVLRNQKKTFGGSLKKRAYSM